MASIWEEAENAAGAVRAEFWGDGIPVDPVQIAHALGIRVRQAELPPQVSGALVKRPGQDAVILLQQGDHENRKRFSCAHELGHYIRRAGEDNFEYVDLRNPKSRTGEDADEQYANRFAAALLMPGPLIQETQAMPIWQAAERFSVSTEAIAVRRRSLGLE